MAHLRVVPVLVNGVTEEEALLDSGSQIVSMTRNVLGNQADAVIRWKLLEYFISI